MFLCESCAPEWQGREQIERALRDRVAALEAALVRIGNQDLRQNPGGSWMKDVADEALGPPATF